MYTGASGALDLPKNGRNIMTSAASITISRAIVPLSIMGMSAPYPKAVSSQGSIRCSDTSGNAKHTATVSTASEISTDHSCTLTVLSMLSCPLAEQASFPSHLVQ